MAVILYELKGDEFLDKQVISIAENFIKNHSSQVSQKY